jgi:hypothetical protein
MSKIERKQRQQKKKGDLKEFEHLLSPEQRKLSNSQKNKLLIDLVSKSAKERNETIQENNSTEVETEKSKPRIKYGYRIKKMKIDGREITFHTDFEHDGNI